MNEASLAAQPGSAYYLLQALLSLLLVVGLIYGAYYLLRRLQVGGLRREAGGPAELLQSLPLAGMNMLHLVRLGPRLVAIVTGPQGSQKVGEWEVEEVLAESERPDL